MTPLNSCIHKNAALKKIKEDFRDKSILILGYGREGASSYHFFRDLFPEKKIVIADQNEAISNDFSNKEKGLVEFHLGENFLSCANVYDVIFKSPGISIKSIENHLDTTKINSQANLFLQYFGSQTIGITGTKGKSTTTYLTFETLRKKYQDNVLLAGNMGIPFFDIIKSINDESIVVCEFSSHQLQTVKYSPHISILLNIFQEHLDHYHSYEEYIESKFNIVKYQTEKDFFIFCEDNGLVSKRVNESHYRSKIFSYSVKHAISEGCFLEKNAIVFKTKGNAEKIHNLEKPLILKGKHNLGNVMAVALVGEILGVENNIISESIVTFPGLPHRLEFVGNPKGISFYNDSISTIPEATIMAVNSLENVSTLILGGFDRGIDYHDLAVFLQQSGLKNIAFTGKAGERIKSEMGKIAPIKQKYIVESSYEKIVEWCFSVAKKGESCVLSPAAASFDQFKNFEERGNFFKKLIGQYGKK